MIFLSHINLWYYFTSPCLSHLISIMFQTISPTGELLSCFVIIILYNLVSSNSHFSSLLIVGVISHCFLLAPILFLLFLLLFHLGLFSYNISIETLSFGPF